MQYVTAKQMAEVDRVAVEDYGVSILQMMENAGRNLARFVAGLKPKKVVVLAGRGNNGGGGLAAARHLSIMGIDTQLVLAEEELGELPRHQYLTLKKMGVPVVDGVTAGKGYVIVDALLGYGIRGAPRGRYRQLVEAANEARREGALIVSLDMPTGIDPDTGEGYGPHVEADYTLTLALPKKGLMGLSNLYVVNIGMPDRVYADTGLDASGIFREGDVVKA